MDRLLNSNIEKQTIYEIYRACRLCGAGAGYKMPIIQNVVDLDGSEVDLKQKIRDCLQIEVHQGDKMPPLICELCVDKVNDYYEFLELCRQTNRRTRLRLGLPQQTLKGSDSGDCILGVTEPVYVNEDSDGEPLSKHKKGQKSKGKKEPEVRVKVERTVQSPRSKETRSSATLATRASKYRQRSPTPPRTRHGTKRSSSDNIPLKRIKEQEQSKNKVLPKSILKKETDKKENNVASKMKRMGEKDLKAEVPAKKVKIVAASPKVSQKPQKVVKLPSRPSRAPPVAHLKRRAVSPPLPHECLICKNRFKTPQALSNHSKIHVVTYTNSDQACNPCGEWFSNVEETNSHHRRHKGKGFPYTCRRCYTDFKALHLYDLHLVKKQCIFEEEVPDLKCESCWRMFPTTTWMEQHKCAGEDGRPGGKCPKCNRSYTLLKNLKRHENTCTFKRRGELIINPELLGKLKPIRIRTAKCDSLLANMKQDHYDVSSVPDDYGLDKNCVYPYISAYKTIKAEPSMGLYNSMVNIRDDVKEEFFNAHDYVHWDSEESDSDIEDNLEKKTNVDSLTTLSLKTIFSLQLLGKVPRKKRKVKPEKLFDGLCEFDNERPDIDSIISNLDCEVNESVSDSKNSSTSDVLKDDSKNSSTSDVLKDDSKNSSTSDVNKDDSRDVVASTDAVDKSTVESEDKDVSSENIDAVEKSADNFDVFVGSTDKSAGNLDVTVGSTDKSANNLDLSISNTDESPDNLDSTTKLDEIETEASVSNKTDVDDKISMEKPTENVDRISNDVLMNSKEEITDKLETNDCNNLNTLNSDTPTDVNGVDSSVNATENINSKSKDLNINNKNDSTNESTQPDLHETKSLAESDSIRNKVNSDDKDGNSVTKNADTNNETHVTKNADINSDFQADLSKNETHNENSSSFSNESRNDKDEEAIKNDDLDEPKSDLTKNDNNDNIKASIISENDFSTIVSNEEKSIDGQAEKSDSNIEKSQINSVKTNVIGNISESIDTRENMDSHVEDNSEDNGNKRNEDYSDQVISNDCVPNKEKVNGECPNQGKLDDLGNENEMDIDDKKLMDALDAQIGESNDVKNVDNDTLENNENAGNDKVTLEDLFPNKNNDDLKSLDLDSISDDEFNFDA